jgi:CTP synthase
MTGENCFIACGNPDTEISIAVVGKYAEHKDAYKSIYEAIDHAGIEHHAQIRVGRILSEDIQREGPERLLSGYDGDSRPRRFRGSAASKVKSTRFVGLDSGRFRSWNLPRDAAAAVIEFAPTQIGLENANSTEFDKNTPHPVVCLLDEQQNITEKGGTMRLGAQAADLAADSKGSGMLRFPTNPRTSPPSLRVR